jgi:hypothetical protein
LEYPIGIIDPYNDPNQLDIGQLAEDYEILRLAHSQHSLVSHNLKNVSALMRFLSEISILNAKAVLSSLVA